MSVLLLDVKAQTEQGKGIHLDEKKRSSHFQFCKIHFKHILVATKGLCQKKSITGKKKMTRMKFLLFVNRKIKVELRNTKALLTIQSCFPLFTLKTSVDICLGKKKKISERKVCCLFWRPEGVRFMHSSDLVSTDNNDTSKT